MDPREDLQTTLEREGAATLHVRFEGKSASREAGRELAPLFDGVIAIATAEQRDIVMHFERLSYFNSSTIAALVQFIRAVQKVGRGVSVVYDGAQKWQVLSFDALKRAMRPFETGKGPSVSFREA